ncbi:MAG: hypothetical protein QNJ45_29660 [Ardenticatenaceae bacterium]|nr:hypothetical protein [Ardenticatenaceae bacterium]
MRWRRLLRGVNLLILILLFVIIAAPEWPAFGDEDYQLRALVGLREYDFVVWELQAIAAKAEALLARDHIYWDEETQRQVVLDYLDLVAHVGQIEWEIQQIYVNPDIADPETASAGLQTRLASHQAALKDVQPFAEAILQDQVAAVLTDEGFSLGGETWPPVMMHMTPLPTILMVSPRDRIERIYGIPLVHGLSIPQREALETAVFENLNLSALVVPIGGLGLYPSMIMETSSLNWLAEVTAHEWAHIWMAPYPVSIKYATDHQVRTMNETTASILGSEIGQKVIATYYPERVPPPPSSDPAPVQDDDAPAFDFRAEMAETRARVDELLAAGQIGTAEAYMELRRQEFVENGYQIRKLNQAYFAFYGAYADEPGATGTDPVGPLVQEVRQLSPTLRDFMKTMAPIGSFAELQKVVGELKAER